MILEWLLPLIPSGIGYFAGIIDVGSFLLAQKRNLLIARLVTDLLFVIHYFLIGAFYGSCLSIIYILGVALGLAKEKITPLIENVARVILCGVAALILSYTYSGMQDILILIATWVSFFMYGIKNNITMRFVAFFVVNPLWLIYAVISGPTPGMLTLIAYEVAVIIGIYRALGINWRHIIGNSYLPRRENKPLDNSLRSKSNIS